MRLDDQDESNNVEDRRGENYGGGGFGNGLGFGRGSMGIGTLIAALAASYFFGIDPLTLLGLVSNFQTPP